MAGIVSCRERPPWARIVRLAQQGRRILDLCFEFGVTRAELEREMRVSDGRSPVVESKSKSKSKATPEISQAAPPPQLVLPSTSPRRRATNAKPPVCSDEEVRALLQADRISWNEAAWLMRTTLKHLRQRAAAEDWSAPVKVRRHAPSREAAVMAKVKAGRLPAAVAAETLEVPVEVIARRVRRA